VVIGQAQAEPAIAPASLYETSAPAAAPAAAQTFEDVAPGGVRTTVKIGRPLDAATLAELKNGAEIPRPKPPAPTPASHAAGLAARIAAAREMGQRANAEYEQAQRELDELEHPKTTTTKEIGTP
jgi:hypothetical protein